MDKEELLAKDNFLRESNKHLVARLEEIIASLKKINEERESIAIELELIEASENKKP